jgi:hypothetical protein
MAGTATFDVDVVLVDDDVLAESFLHPEKIIANTPVKNIISLVLMIYGCL